MIDKFEKGKWYVFTGSEPSNNWNLSLAHIVLKE